MIKLTKETAILTGIILILFFAVLYAASRGAFGRRRPDLELKADGGGVITTDSGAIDTAVYENKADAIYNALSGWNFSSEGMQSVYNILIGATDNEIRLINNSYNQLYGSDEYYPTIRALLDGEYLSCGSWYNFGYVSPACSQKREIQERLARVGI